MEASLRLVRIVWMAMLVAGFLYVWIPEQVHVQPHDLAPTFYWAMIALSIVTLAVMLVVRKATIDRASEVLRANPNDTASLMRWRAGYIVTFTLCEAIVLYGLVLRFVGATLEQATLLYLLGLVPMVVLRPRQIG